MQVSGPDFEWIDNNDHKQVFQGFTHIPTNISSLSANPAIVHCAISACNSMFGVVETTGGS